VTDQYWTGIVGDIRKWNRGPLVCDAQCTGSCMFCGVT